MAGKRKNTDDTAGMSKTARASALKKGGKQDGFVAAAPENLERIQSLNGGNYVRILKPTDGKSLHLRVGSIAYFDAVASLGDRIVSELERKGFPTQSPMDEFMAQVDANDQALFEALDRQEAR